MIMLCTVVRNGANHESGGGWSIVVTSNVQSDSFTILSHTQHVTMRVAALRAAAMAFKAFVWSDSKIGTLNGSAAQLADF